jgi:protease-4
MVAQSSQKKAKREWKIFKILWRALKKMCTALGALVLISIFFSLLSASMLTKYKPSLPNEMVLLWHAKGPLLESPPQSSLSDLAPDFLDANYTFRDLIDALDEAISDERVKGFVTVLNYGSFSLSHLYELRDAIKRFEDSGKFTYIYSPSYGELGSGLGAYYLASSFQEIWMQPMGTLSLTGVYLESPYLSDFLKKVGVQAQFEGRKEYKTVFENFTHNTMSTQNQTMLKSIINDYANYTLNEVAADRDLTFSELKDTINNFGIIFSEEAESLGLVDKLDYGDVLTRKINLEVTGTEDIEKVSFVSISRYLSRVKEKEIHKKSDPINYPKVALVHLDGAMVSYAKSANVSFGSQFISARRISKSILEAADDENVKAIVIRINSPGGSPVAAETVHRAIVRAKEKGKLVVVSMGSTAASAGYWAASPADYIFATPLTLTGSIGVAGGKFNAQEMWSMIGVNWESVQWGEMADLWSMNKPFSETQHKRFSQMLDRTYDNFISKVASGRELEKPQVEAVAKGRAWTGLEAKEKKLIDEIGGLIHALDYVAQQFNAENRHKLSILVLPKKKTPLEQIAELLQTQSGLKDTYNTYYEFSKLLRPFVDEVSTYNQQLDLLTLDSRASSIE